VWTNRHKANKQCAADFNLAARQQGHAGQIKRRRLLCGSRQPGQRLAALSPWIVWRHKRKLSNTPAQRPCQSTCYQCSCNGGASHKLLMFPNVPSAAAWPHLHQLLWRVHPAVPQQQQRLPQPSQLQRRQLQQHLRLLSKRLRGGGGEERRGRQAVGHDGVRCCGEKGTAVSTEFITMLSKSPIADSCKAPDSPSSTCGSSTNACKGKAVKLTRRKWGRHFRRYNVGCCRINGRQTTQHQGQHMSSRATHQQHIGEQTVAWQGTSQKGDKLHTLCGCRCRCRYCG
jgi:hypothetical protein